MAKAIAGGTTKSTDDASKHEYHENTATEVMAMLANHEQYSWHALCARKQIAVSKNTFSSQKQNPSHSSKNKSNYFHSGAMLDFFWGYAGSRRWRSAAHSSVGAIRHE